MARLFRDCPEAVTESATLLSRIRISLEALQYEYPNEPVLEGWTPQGWLEHLVMEEAHKLHPNGRPAKQHKILDEEFTHNRGRNSAINFMTGHDRVQNAQTPKPHSHCQRT